MGLRIAAAVATAAIVIALVAAFFAARHAPVGYVPAADDKNVAAYRALIGDEYYQMNASTSNSCNTIQDTTCAYAIGRVIPTLQRWVNDLQAFKTPANYVALDGQLRHHLTSAIADLNAVVSFQKRNDSSGFDLARNAATYERAWIDPTSFAIEGSYSRVAGSFHDAVSLVKQSLTACVNGTPAPGDRACTQLTQQVCESGGPQGCEIYVQDAATQLQTFLVALTQNPAPASLAAKDARLRSDLALADTALLDITDGLLTGDSGKVVSGQSSYTSAITSAQADASAIATS